MISTNANKRLQILAQLNTLYGIGPVTAKADQGLKTFVTTLTKTAGVLRSLGVDVNTAEGGVLLVHHLAKLLDRATQEAWDCELKSTREFPAFDQLKELLTSHA